MELSNIKTKLATFLGNIKPLYVIIFVVIVIAIQGAWAYQALRVTDQFEQSEPKSNKTGIETKALNTISLTVPKTDFKVGEMIPVGINIESDKTTAGADIIIHYDANLLALTPTSSKSAVTVGTLYDEYPINQSESKSGVITVSGITNNIAGVIPNGLFGTILFQAKAAGSAKVFIEFTKGKTNDSNIIENKKSADVLEQVKNLDLKINQ
ncbi:MAG: cohesin domain-containing protein [Candidatus Daviesbacteria bacterium]|nr:cohesin domain-containing protein [Candidatus Daviesbacteria bacterium]